MYSLLLYIAPLDYTATTQTLVFGPSTIKVDVIIPINDDDFIAESVEQFFARLTLTNTNSDVDVSLNPAETNIEIIDNDSKLPLPYQNNVHDDKKKFHLICFYIFLVVQIGFEEILYMVNEADGQVVLSVAVLSGQLSSDVLIRINTADNSAVGKFRANDLHKFSCVDHQ